MGNARIRILQSAWDLLTEDPLRTRMEDVAVRAKVSRQAVYLHFADRAALLVAVARHADETLGIEAAIRPVREAPDGLSMLDRLAEFLGDYLPKVNEIAWVLESLELSDEGAKAAVADRTADRADGCRQMAQRLKTERLLAKGLGVEAAAALLLGLSSTAYWRELTRVAGLSKQSYVKQLKRALRLVLTSSPAASKRSA